MAGWKGIHLTIPALEPSRPGGQSVFWTSQEHAGTARVFEVNDDYREGTYLSTTDTYRAVLLRQLVITFQQMLVAQTGYRGSYPVTEASKVRYVIDLEDWPENLPFGDWFDILMKSFMVEVRD